MKDGDGLTVMQKAIFTLLLLFLLTACRDDDEIPVTYSEGTNEYVNQWVYEQMKRYYYWNSSIPGNIDLSLGPKEYFKQLLSPEDPFSYLYHPSIPGSYPKSLRRSYGFDMAMKEYQGHVYGVVLYTLTSSPAENAGLQRGTLVYSVNGVELSRSNYDQLYESLVNSEQAQLQTLTFSEEEGFSPFRQINIYQSYTYDQYVSWSVIEHGSKKAGFVYIPHFDEGLARRFVEIFSDLKGREVTDIVLDLRYNTGGDVSSATALCSILAPDIRYDDLFIRFVGNENGGTVSQTFEEALAMNEPGVSFESLCNAHPSITRVYILCGSHTASASEIVINNLKPYMEVITIGETTTGKDVAGFTIEDDRYPDGQGWVLYPAIYKLFNANEEGNYAMGITPDYMLNELESLEVKPLGDINEVLLKKALGL